MQLLNDRDRGMNKGQLVELILKIKTSLVEQLSNLGEDKSRQDLFYAGLVKKETKEMWDRKFIDALMLTPFATLLLCKEAIETSTINKQHQDILEKMLCALLKEHFNDEISRFGDSCKATVESLSLSLLLSNWEQLAAKPSLTPQDVLNSIKENLRTSTKTEHSEILLRLFSRLQVDTTEDLSHYFVAVTDLPQSYQIFFNGLLLPPKQGLSNS